MVELLVTLSIATIVLTVGISGLAQLVAQSQRASEANTLAGNLNYARAEAIYRATDVVVCPIDPDNLEAEPADPCAEIAAADGDLQWAQGYVVYVPDTGERLRLQSARNGVTIETNGRAEVHFHDDGSASGYNLTLKVCDRRDNAASDDARPQVAAQPRAVIVSAPGRVRVTDRTSDGGAIDCSSKAADDT